MCMIYEMNGKIAKCLMAQTKGVKDTGLCNTFWVYKGRVIASDTYRVAVIDAPAQWAHKLDPERVYKPTPKAFSKMLVGDGFTVREKGDGFELCKTSKNGDAAFSLDDFTDKLKNVADHCLAWADGIGEDKAEAVPDVLGYDPRYVADACELARALGYVNLKFEPFWDKAFPMLRVVSPDGIGFCVAIAARRK